MYLFLSNTICWWILGRWILNIFFHVSSCLFSTQDSDSYVRCRHRPARRECNGKRGILCVLSPVLVFPLKLSIQLFDGQKCHPMGRDGVAQSNVPFHDVFPVNRRVTPSSTALRSRLLSPTSLKVRLNSPHSQRLVIQINFNESHGCPDLQKKISFD